MKPRGALSRASMSSGSVVKRAAQIVSPKQSSRPGRMRILSRQLNRKPWRVLMKVRVALLTTSLLALVAAQPALAQQSDQQDTQKPQSTNQGEHASDEIVVTATTLATNVQDDPIAITADTAK